MRVKSDWHIHQAKPYFSKKCERARVWAASCERTFGGIGKAKAASEGTDNLRHTQTKSQKNDEYFHFSQVFGRKGVVGLGV